MAKIKPARTAEIPVLALRPGDAAKAAGVSERTIFMEVAAGRLASKKVGRGRLIPVADLEAWVANLPAG
jgi:excisionase family DNA binding protein